MRFLSNFGYKNQFLAPAFSLYEEQAQDLSEYCHVHSFLIFYKKLRCIGKQR